MAISSRVTKKISSPVTKRNPRPRKYASQADRQAAYRARNVMLEFRAEPKTADNITKIADTLGYPRSDVLLSMVKFALTNHDWARFGLTHKTIPTYKENPTMKPASPAQLAARKRFAEMARSGAFKKATKRKANPITETVIWGLAPGETRDYMEEIMYGGGQKLTKEQVDKVIEAATKAGYHSFRIGGIDMTKKPDFAGAVKTIKRKANPTETGMRYQIFKSNGPLDSEYKTLAQMQSALDEIDRKPSGRYYGYDKAFGRTYHSFAHNQHSAVVKNNPMHKYTVLHRGTANVAGEVTASGPQAAKQKVAEKLGIPTLAYLVAKKTNPAKKTVSQKVSQLVNEGYPQRQAVAVALSEQRAGKVKRNPMMKEAISRLPSNFKYGVQTKATENWGLQAAFKTKIEAQDYAKAINKNYPHLPIRVITFTGGNIK